MELSKARITNFRSIDDSGWVTIDEITCLVGKNESGKSNFLQALARMNPRAGDPSGFVLTDDFPRHGLNDIEEAFENEEVNPDVIEVEYRLTEAEVAAAAELFGESTVKTTVRLVKRLDGSREWTTVLGDEGHALKHLLRETKFSQELRNSATTCTTVAALHRLATEHASASDSFQLVVDRLNEWPATDLEDAVSKWLLAREPLYLYFGEYDVMPGSINMRELHAKAASSDQMSPKEKTFLALLDAAGAKTERFQAATEYEALKARLESASLKISRQLYDYWKQNQESKIEFDTDKVLRNPNNGATDLILSVRVKNEVHGVSVPMDRRSNGFVWFFSFLVNFGQIRRHYPDRQLVLLLDEPGTALHGLAQEDFLRVLDEKIAPEHQVIYTTHHPFLVDPNRLDRARPVEDIRGEGTKVSNDPYHVHGDTIFPLQAVLGYAIGQTLFVAPNVLLVEGPSDLVYLQLLSRAVERHRNAPGLDRRWAVTPVGGVSKMDGFVRLFGSNQLNICALVDVSSGRLSAVEKLAQNGELDDRQVVKVTEFTQTDFADIEDLFEPDFYLGLVRGGCKGVASMLTPEVLAEFDDDRIIERIDRVMTTKLNDKPIDHMPPARYLEENSHLLDELGDATLDRAVQLFERINAQLKR